MPVLGMIGFVLAGLGTLCGALLLLTPLTGLAAYGLMASGNSLQLGLLFVVLNALGFGLTSSAGKGKQGVNRSLRLLGGVWLALGGVSLVLLVASLAGLVAASGTLIWWLMGPAGIAAGTLVTLMGSQQPGEPD